MTPTTLCLPRRRSAGGAASARWTSASWTSCIIHLHGFQRLLTLVQAERRWTSFTALDQRILDIFYWWSVFSVFLGAMLGGSIFSQFRVALQDPGALL